MIVGFLFKYKLLNRTYRLKYHREMCFISELRVIFVMFLWGIQSTRMNHHFAKWLIIRYSNKSPIFFALYWRPGSCVIRCLREGILLCVYCFSVDFMDHISYHFLHFSDFEAFFGWEQIRLSILFRVLIRKFGIYSQVNLCNIWKKTESFPTSFLIRIFVLLY